MCVDVRTHICMVFVPLMYNICAVDVCLLLMYARTYVWHVCFWNTYMLYVCCGCMYILTYICAVCSYVPVL